MCYLILHLSPRLFTIYTLQNHNHPPNSLSLRPYFLFTTTAVCTPTKVTRIRDFLNPHLAKPRSFTEIGHILGIDRRTVARNYERVKRTGDCYSRPSKPGRPRLLTPRDVRRAKIALAQGVAPDATHLQMALFPTVSARTMRRVLCENGLPGQV